MTTATETLFTKIIKREIPSTIVYETDSVIAFKDITPQAPVHILVVPKKVIKDVGAATKDDQGVLGELLLAAAEVARQEGLAPDGYRLVINTGRSAGQTVFHLHIHLLGGRSFAWPPG
jgi:histidine triad (HIT) family protein